jgi:hypothetical protein
VANDLIGPNHGFGVSEELLAKLSVVMEWGLDRIFFVSSSIAVLALLFGLFFPQITHEEPPLENKSV